MMSPKSKKSNTPRRLEKSNDSKLLSYIQQLRGDGDRTMSVGAVLDYVQSADHTFRRMKKLQLEKAIERVLQEFKKTKIQDEGLGRIENALEISDDEDDESAIPEGVAMMEVKDTNAMNKSLTNLWNIHRPASNGASPSPLTPDIPISTVGAPATPAVDDSVTIDNTTPTQPQEDVSGKKKRRARTSMAGGGEAKRHKGTRGSRYSRGEHTNIGLTLRTGFNFIFDSLRLLIQGSDEGHFVTPTTKLSDLGGIESCIEEVLELIAMPLAHPEVYLHTGVQPPRGILLHGPPGCGKTMLAHAIAGELGVPFINISAPSIVSGMSGESEKKIRDVFDEAKVDFCTQLAPCLLFIDEIDAITPKRETAQREMERRIVAQLLTCLDDLSWEKTNNKTVMIIGATNRPDSLDPALRRAGRFDREIALGVPDEIAREKCVLIRLRIKMPRFLYLILRVLAAKLRLSGEFDFQELAKQTPGYVGADLNALTTAAGVIAVKRIFKYLRHVPSIHKASAAEPNLGDSSNAMQEDTADSAGLPIRTTTVQEFEEQSTIEQLRSISEFIRSHPDPLTSAQLEPLAITRDDFLQALKKVQPSSKREGFATVPGVTWEDIGALTFVRDELRMAVVEPIRHPEFFKRVGITAPAGVLLWGPPGCGKTLLAKAVANESHTNFISVKGPELLNKYVGESERGVRQVFARARASAPCVIFFDELDALCGKRDDSQLDGVENRSQVYVIAATNRPDMIDPAMLRPGRLDKLLYVELPTPEERYEILKKLTKRTPLTPNTELETIANDHRCEGFSGADLAALVRESAVAALRSTLYAHGTTLSAADASAHTASADAIFVTKDHFHAAFEKVAPSVSKQ
ncbi:hypothetical protein BC938DRAFT_480039, partial [Jimgerdemannia flammicorona]